MDLDAGQIETVGDRLQLRRAAQRAARPDPRGSAPFRAADDVRVRPDDATKRRVRLVPEGLLERAEEHVRALCAHDAVAPFDHEERHAGRAELARLLAVALDLAAELARLERLADGHGIQAHLRRQLHERIGVEDRSLLSEVGARDAIPGLGLAALPAGVGEELVGKRRVVRAVVQHVVRLQALALGHRFDVAGHRLDLLICGRTAAQPEFLGQALAHGRGDTDGNARIELERTVDDFDVAPMDELAERLLEPVLSESAPGTDDVGPDLDGHDGLRGGGGVSAQHSRSVARLVADATTGNLRRPNDASERSGCGFADCRPGPITLESCHLNSFTPRTSSPGTTRRTRPCSRTSRSRSTRAPRSASSGRTGQGSRVSSASWPGSTTASPERLGSRRASRSAI